MLDEKFWQTVLENYREVEKFMNYNKLAIMRKETVEKLEQASALVATWPAWKRNLLRDSNKSTTTPRQPIYDKED